MFDTIRFALTLVTALGCGLIAGVFFAFSSFVMKALARIAPAAGIAAMQSINIVVLNPVFLTAFVGTAAACVLLIIAALTRWHTPSTVWVLVGGALYLVGSFGVTMLFNVPMNDALASVVPTDLNSASRWARYCADWTTWNHVRTVASLAAAAAFTIALRQ